MGPSKKQIFALANATKRINMFVGPVRSGKTFVANTLFLEQCYSVSYDKFLLSGQTKETLKRNVTTDIIKLIGKDNCTYNENLGELKFSKDGETRVIYCLGAADEPSLKKIQGGTFGGWYADELPLQQKSFRDMARTRLSVPKSKIYWTMNPDSPFHDVYTDYISSSAPKNKEVFLLNFLLDDNPSLTEEYKHELRTSYSGVFYRRMILGEWCLAEGVIYDMFSESSCVIDYEPQIIKYFVSCDYGTASTFVLLLFGVDASGIVYVLDEWSWDAKEKLQQKTDGEFLVELKKFIAGIPVSTIYPDPSATSFIALLKQNGFIVGDTDNDVITGIRIVGNGFKTANLKVHKRCVKLIKEVSSAYVWDDRAQLKGVDKPLKKNDHCSDTLRYGYVTHTLRGHSALSVASVDEVYHTRVQQHIIDSHHDDISRTFAVRHKIPGGFQSWLKRKRLGRLRLQ